MMNPITLFLVVVVAALGALAVTMGYPVAGIALVHEKSRLMS
jgi:heme A synthase